MNERDLMDYQEKYGEEEEEEETLHIPVKDQYDKVDEVADELIANAEKVQTDARAIGRTKAVVKNMSDKIKQKI